MSQINVNAPEPAAPSGDRSAAAGINLVTVLIVLAVLAVIAWFLFTGPLRSLGGPVNVNVNPAPTSGTTINVNPPSQPNAPAPANNNQAPAKPATQP